MHSKIFFGLAILLIVPAFGYGAGDEGGTQPDNTGALPSHGWTRTWGGSGLDGGSTVAIDASGNA